MTHRRRECPTCGAPIFWARDAAGAELAMDPQTTILGTYRLREVPGGDPLAVRELGGPGLPFEAHIAGCRGLTSYGKRLTEKRGRGQSPAL